jgi:eukaryotic translation initiation factor 2C
MEGLLKAFEDKNGCLPVYIVVYRDGVSDGQFDQVLENEVPCIKQALENATGQESLTKICVVICQKGHHTRLAFEEKDGTYVNLCPGVVVDATGGNDSISSASYNEFYLNSHVAIQGTSKPTKYSLLYDEIGMKVAELELLTYWSTYLYSRCNRSVSMATPAYYAHWAAQRARNLVAAGASNDDLTEVSRTWSLPDRNSSMFFL